MTNEEAKDLLDNLIGMVEDNQNNDYDEALKLAIRSLKAWEEVLAELKSAKVNNIPCDSAEEAIGIGKGLTYAIDIINQKLAEIEE